MKTYITGYPVYEVAKRHGIARKICTENGEFSLFDPNNDEPVYYIHTGSGIVGGNATEMYYQVPKEGIVFRHFTWHMEPMYPVEIDTLAFFSEVMIEEINEIAVGAVGIIQMTALPFFVKKKTLRPLGLVKMHDWMKEKRPYFNATAEELKKTFQKWGVK